jgi:hypothetical protein
MACFIAPCTRPVKPANGFPDENPLASACYRGDTAPPAPVGERSHRTGREPPEDQGNPMRNTKCEEARTCEDSARCEERPSPGEKHDNPFSLRAIIAAFL